MAKPIHMFELPVEIEPFRPGVERGTSLMSHIVVSAAVVAFCARVTVAPAKLLEDLSGPPVEMGIDDPHGVALSSKRITHRKAILSSRHDAESRAPSAVSNADGGIRMGHPASLRKYFAQGLFPLVGQFQLLRTARGSRARQQWNIDCGVTSLG